MPRIVLLFCVIVGVAATCAAKCDINKASVAELQSIPGIGPKTAATIVEYRREHGPFKRIEDIMNVPRLGPGIFAKIRDIITVGGTASQPVSAAPEALDADAAGVVAASVRPMLPEGFTERTCWSCSRHFFVQETCHEGWCPYCGARWKVRAREAE
ncbi:helix-hairpin-helix domain-containing protein [bacterium]|nr:helix-hairpin-helix domain-containing protein [candidate division CSSED10-310 bacterium]